MKKICLSLCLVFVGAVCGFAQMFKVTSNTVEVGNPQFGTFPGHHFTLRVVGTMHQFAQTSAGSSGWLRMQLGTTSPRISGASSCVVFYDGITSVFNDIQVRNVYNYSDGNAKTNVRLIFNASDIINKLNPVTFDWVDAEPRKSQSGVPLQEIGFIAQEVEEVLPEVVILDEEEGNKLVNYTALIPLLTKAVQELTQKVNELEEAIALSSVFRSSNSPTGIDGDIDPTIALCKLYQNTPNPFTENTHIKFYIPENIKAAQLCIYDLQGKQIKQFSLINRGDVSQIILGSELSAGIYLYSLIADGTVVDTKRMILTK